jgi:hypothetical protein
MFGEIPKLFGRGFVIGYLLPSTIFLAYLAYGLGLDIFAIGSVATFTVEGMGRAGLGLAIIALALLLLNRPFVRILEGYYRFNPLTLLKPLQKHRFKRIAKSVDDQWKALEQAWREDLDPDFPVGFGRRAAFAASSFPHRLDLVLPTRFGNTYRSYETYPTMLYGMDAVVLWPRLVCVLPRAAREQLQESRAKLDFHVNMFWLSLLAGIIAMLPLSHWHPWRVVPPLISVILLWPLLATSARAWGITFTSMFDLYRAPLAEALGLELPPTLESERTMWREVSRFILYRRAYTGDFLDSYRSAKVSRKTECEE